MPYLKRGLANLANLKDVLKGRAESRGAPSDAPSLGLAGPPFLGGPRGGGGASLSAAGLGRVTGSARPASRPWALGKPMGTADADALQGSKGVP
jgi:hypothetical protein